MKKSLDKGRMIIGILYAFGLVGMLSILLVIGISRQEETKMEREEAYWDISSLWTLDKEGTQPVNIKNWGSIWMQNVECCPSITSFLRWTLTAVWYIVPKMYTLVYW